MTSKGLLATLLLLTITVFTFSSCNKEELLSSKDTSAEASSFTSHQLVGDFHNDALGLMISEVPETGRASSFDDVEDIYWKAFNETASLEKYTSDHNFSLALGSASLDMPLMIQLLSPEYQNNVEEKANAAIAEMQRIAVVTPVHASYLTEIIDEAGDLSRLEEIKEDWAERKLSLENKVANDIVESTLELTISSTIFWGGERNRGTILKIPPHAVADAGGFVIGAGLAAAREYAGDGIQAADTTGIIMGGLTGALAGSLGAAGRVGRWLLGKF